MEVAIIKYNAGNVISVENALRRLGVTPVITDDKALLQAADKVIFPGVGEASTTMAYLREHRLDELIVNLKQPVLGICIGMQLMCRHSEEGNVDCLGIFDTEVKRFQAQQKNDKIPQMGWNTVSQMQTPLFEGINPEEYVYYVHSYYAELCRHTIARTEYLLPYSAALHRDNFYAVQFHPEKSSEVGARILNNFLNL
ncbi:MAG: imidazole glycerol phosphate synthase subunit HisH [Bacteroidales bacterium]|nr:imidazole glycerol phosphate synthase subunit HisH [Bacteroidales bacterium]MBO5818167.1 imidazole glycerol phosphate synthase subunit HisH [Bacteroidales bacterium]MBO5916110.1 imidazole glycerol phosphate synthase subunit HisH [Bacteroidales bacterium]MBQ2447235.1 imidazole glycerol phosphate synthase subunit HisH [Bacteroidales bacterium]MBQ5605415.1 imidazole glycerol phosphate synthase subunit HisH [Bacteroidales bacterium]